MKSLYLRLLDLSKELHGFGEWQAANLVSLAAEKIKRRLTPAELAGLDGR